MKKQLEDIPREVIFICFILMVLLLNQNSETNPQYYGESSSNKLKKADEVKSTEPKARPPNGIKQCKP